MKILIFLLTTIFSSTLSFADIFRMDFYQNEIWVTKTINGKIEKELVNSKEASGYLIFDTDNMKVLFSRNGGNVLHLKVTDIEEEGVGM